MLSLPASIEMVLQLCFGLIDTVFVSNLGETAMAGVSLSNKIISLLIVIYGTVGIGGSILISQHYGNGDKKKVSEISGQLFIFGILFGITSAVLIYNFSDNILGIMGANKEVIQQGSVFLKIMAISIPINLLVILIVAIFRSIGNTKTPMIITFTAICINTLLNYILIFGFMWIKPMGVEGAAVATLISKIINFILILYCLFFTDNKIKFYIKHFLTLSVASFFKVIKLSIPVTISETCWAAGAFAYTILFTRLGTRELVANQVILSIEDIFVMFAFGLTVSGLTIIGQEIGAKKYEQMHRATKEILKIGAVLSVAYIFLFTLLGFSVQGIFRNISNESIELAKWGVVFFGFIQPAKIVNFILDNGILKGGNDTRFTMYANFAVVFLVGIPCAYILGFLLNMGFWGVCIGRFAEEIARFILMYTRYKSDKWYKSVIEPKKGTNVVSEINT